MRRGFTVPGSLLLLCVAVQESAACEAAHTPHGQSIVRFYDSESFGRLGVKGLGDNLYILDRYQCYEISFLRNKNLSIYFNSTVQGEVPGPTYVGAVIARAFSPKGASEGQYSAYFYRNSSTKSGGESKWAHAIDAQGSLDHDSWGAASSFRLLTDVYDRDQAVRAPSLRDLVRQMQISTSQAADQLKQWHALIVVPESGGFRVQHNSEQSDSRWNIDLADDNPGSSYLIVRNYLVKYQASPNPTPTPFFTVGAQDADCIYIKLVAPGDTLSTFALRRDGGSSDVITLKMKRNAVCREPR
jgi:hypothetical protein